MATASKKSSKKAAAPKAEKAAAPKAPKAPKAERSAPRERSIKVEGQMYGPESRLRFGLINPGLQEGEEGYGERWSTKRGPRREGSQKAELWSQLKNNMSIKQAKEAGIPSSFISKSLKRGWLESDPSGAPESNNVEEDNLAEVQ